MNKITISLFGRKYQQRYYKIDEQNTPIINEWISSSSSKLQINPVASRFPLQHTTQILDPDMSWLSIKQNNELVNIEPYLVSNNSPFNLIYGLIDESSYNEGIVVDSNRRAITTDPIQWHNDTQRVYDFLHNESFISPLCSIVLSGIQDSSITEQEYLVNTITGYSLFEFEFYLSTPFYIDELGLFLDPYTNCFTYKECVIPDFVLYDDVFRCGKEIYSFPVKLDWTKCLVRNITMDVVAEHRFPEEKCNTGDTVPF